MKQKIVKILKNDHWIYGINTTCSFCNKPIFTTCENIKPGKPNICSPDCKRLYYLRKKDSNAFNLLHLDDLDLYYLVGLICSDGYICYPHSSPSVKGFLVGIELHKKDVLLLETIKNKFGGILRKNKKGNCYKWSISMKEFVIYLRDIVGITSKKSHTLNINKWFNDLTISQKHSFMRGVFDGDGCICKTITRKQIIWTSFICTCSKNFLKTLTDYFTLNNANIHTYQTPTKNGTIYTVKCHGTFVNNFLQNMYEYDGIRLERKYNKWKEYNKEIGNDIK